MQKLAWLKRLRGVEMTANEFRVLVTLSTFTDSEGGNAFPAVLTLADACCMDRRAIQRCLRSLEDKKLIIKTSEGGNALGYKRAAVYRLGDTEEGSKGGRGDALKGGHGGAQGRSIWSSKGGTGTAPSVPISKEHQRCRTCKKKMDACLGAQSYPDDTHDYEPESYDPTEAQGLCVTCNRTYLGHERAAGKGGDRHNFEPRYGTDAFTSRLARGA